MQLRTRVLPADQKVLHGRGREGGEGAFKEGAVLVHLPRVSYFMLVENGSRGDRTSSLGSSSLCLRQSWEAATGRPVCERNARQEWITCILQVIRVDGGHEVEAAQYWK